MIDLFGLESISLAWHNHLAEVLGNCMGFKYLLANSEVWFTASMDKDSNNYPHIYPCLR